MKEMEREILYFEPAFREVIWGGTRLRDIFGYNIVSEKTGECMAISADANYSSVVKNGTYKGRNLKDLWENERQLFGNIRGDVFPLLIKIIDASEDLSIQVHPDDEYARVHENGKSGKNECWYVLDCRSDETIVIGHNGKDDEDTKTLVKNGRWGEFIREIPTKKGDFFQINAGCVHAIKGGTLILEVQQNSDVTYRLYDYDRLQDGMPRELHTDKSLDVIVSPYTECNTSPTNVFTGDNGSRIDNLHSCRYYSVYRIIVNEGKNMTETLTWDVKAPFVLISVIEGGGRLDGNVLGKGDNVLVPYGNGSMNFSGDMEIIATTL